MIDYIMGHNCETHEIPPGHSKYGHLHIFDFESYPILINRFNDLFGKGLEIIESLPIDDKVGNDVGAKWVSSHEGFSCFEVCERGL